VDLLAIGLGDKHLDGWDWLPVVLLCRLVVRVDIREVEARGGILQLGVVP
jgi:hypothetical protein